MTAIEEGWSQKQRQRSSGLFGGQILFNALDDMNQDELHQDD